ncbi:hypothetical protein A2291_01935 [candidate division WOR-1 bacterium RIFOXYB2_FULL_42_35]|uniref:Uncharacterized protein n=1 Tax=candidate division WOR-1 bacterium RIFOXYC2_FULL_41_25 TaxID=1802586 RepID=A0A1F4TQ69_UNCSA|nr:MAG: hypothetical protein A2247_03735 [candidate division WOR-1 bacterium RIFOXYA2_FULL_41_14]OGC25163.1 MAG: hypothetical protein A2291_01935 [candidate division WOR-1 bacterium RIFOXYB2_FULL_42_35]OGC34719.1 MAG: hypothetical protein A2462_03250 [candidate division WOR-1 bacterium RIFOXYC2_FULL_41_25]
MTQFLREITKTSEKKIYAVYNAPAFWVGQLSGYEYSLRNNHKQLTSLDMHDIRNGNVEQRRGL